MREKVALEHSLKSTKYELEDYSYYYYYSCYYYYHYYYYYYYYCYYYTLQLQQQQLLLLLLLLLLLVLCGVVCKQGASCRMIFKRRRGRGSAFQLCDLWGIPWTLGPWISGENLRINDIATLIDIEITVKLRTTNNEEEGEYHLSHVADLKRFI